MEFRINFSQVFNVKKADLDYTPCGFLKLPVRVSRIGVMEYRNANDEPTYECKPPEELFNPKTMESLRHIPVTDKHPQAMFVTPENSKELMVGFMSGEPIIEDDTYLSSDLIITDQTIIDRLVKKFDNNETQEVSAGYSATIEKTPGTFIDTHYDTVQRDVVFNHCALVSVGRAGRDCRLIFPGTQNVWYGDSKDNNILSWKYACKAF